MRFVVGRLVEQAGNTEGQADVDYLASIIDTLDRTVSDYWSYRDKVAGHWLVVIPPVWFEMLTKCKCSRSLHQRFS